LVKYKAIFLLHQAAAILPGFYLIPMVFKIVHEQEQKRGQGVSAFHFYRFSGIIYYVKFVLLYNVPKQGGQAFLPTRFSFHKRWDILL